MERPQITLILAMTADGKIADRERSPARFSSPRDLEHLEKQIATADGVMFGASTLRAYGTTLRVSQPQLLQRRQQQGLSAQPVQIVCSAGAMIDSNLKFFNQAVPHWLLTTEKGALPWQEKKQKFFDEIIIAQKNNLIQIDWHQALAKLQLLNINKIALLGGGNLAASLLRENLIDEYYLTLCPVILGGEAAPTPIEGLGLLSKEAKALELLSVERVDQEVFLHYRTR